MILDTSWDDKISRQVGPLETVPLRFHLPFFMISQFITKSVPARIVTRRTSWRIVEINSLWSLQFIWQSHLFLNR